MQICDDSHLRLKFGRNRAPLKLKFAFGVNRPLQLLYMWATSTGKENPKHNPENNGTGKYWHFLCNHSWPEQHEFIRPRLYCYCFPLPSFRWKWADRPSVHLRRKLLCFPVKLGGQSQTTRTLFDSYFYPLPSALQLAFVFSMTLFLHIFSPLNTFSPFGSHLCDHLRAEYLGFLSCFVSAIVAFMFACGDALIKRLTSARYDKGHLHFYISIS